MSQRTLLLEAVLCGAFAGSLVACAQPSQSAASTDQADQARSGLPDRDPALARRLSRDDGALLIDVRTQEEWDEGHIEGAVLIPIDELPDRMGEIEGAAGGDKTKPIVVYCRSGGRAGRAKQSLLDAGYENVSNLGGVSDWCEDCE